MKVRAFLKNYRVAPRKARLLTSLVKGLPVAEALSQLERSIKGSAPQVRKLVASALANAENNFGLDRKNLYVFDMRVDEGPTMKRWLPRAFGRATPLHKRTSRITVVLEEFVEGAGRKTKEQLEEARKKRAGKVKKEEAEEPIEEKKSRKTPEVKPTEKKEKGTKSSGFAKKVFQRKSA